MAKYTITYRCGHTAVVQLYGKDEDRQRKIKWYSTIDCRECDAKAQAAKAEDMQLPSLTGSEKQIAWANRLRIDALETLDGYTKLAPEANRPIIVAARKGWLAKETSAKYWIDNRDELDNIRDISILLSQSVDMNALKKEYTK